jgi:hypothetical protein
MVEEICAKNQNYQVMKPYRCEVRQTIQWLRKCLPPDRLWLAKVPVICNICQRIQTFVEV